MNKFEVTFILDNRELKIDLVELAKIGNDLNKDIRDHSGIFAYHAAICEEALAEYERTKEELSEYEAALFIELKKAGVVEGVKATEKLIDNAIIIDDERMELKREELKAKEIYRKLLAGKEALVHKKDHLSTLSANLRKDTENF